MKLDMDIFKAKGATMDPVKGRLLIAEPILPDVIFSRSVTFLVDDTSNKHSGLILNKTAGIKLGKVLPEFKDADFDVFLGGPVETERLFYLHSYGDLIKGAVKVTDELWWGGDFSAVKEMLHAGVLKPDKIMFFLGYSGWTEGQLKDELDDGAWLVADVPGEFVFSDSESKWSRSLNFVDAKYKIWRNFPEDPELN
ncbi:MAG: YqgE/AlgH family protein [Bacteroidota bacterium]|nr:YqgE/AlgH family protein [Bacteroidota bacterium]